MKPGTATRLSNPPAVIVGGDLDALGVARSLSHARCPIYVLDSTRHRPAHWSRHCRTVLVPTLSGPSLIDSLVDLGDQLGGRPFLVITEEPALSIISEARHELEPLFRFSLPSKEMVRTLQNKALFHRFALKSGLPVPRSVILDRQSDPLSLLTLRFPLVLKPAEKHRVPAGEMAGVYRARDFGEAEAILAKLFRLTPELVAQQWVDGADDQIYFSLFFRPSGGEEPVVFAGRKLVCNPPAIGSTAVCVPGWEAGERLDRLTKRFLQASDYRGIGSLEFKWDALRREFVIIEPTVGRTDLQEEVATLNGVNIPLAAYRDAFGLRQAAAAPALPDPGPAAWRENLTRRVPRGLSRELRVYDGYWRLNDPLPGLVYYGNRALGLARGLTRPGAPKP